MLSALDSNNNKILASNASKSGSYFCPSCLNELIFRNGKIVVQHFSHKSKTSCDGSYKNKGEWHQNWQECFEEECREIVLTGEDGSKRRVDVKVGKNVVEFQHSSMSQEEFNSRNRFYNNLGFDVYWVFDMSKQYSEKRMFPTNFAGHGDEWWMWNNRSKTFDGFQFNENKQVHLFFDLGCEFYGNDYFIIHPTWHMGMSKDKEKRSSGFHRFVSEDWYNREKFIDLIKSTSNGIRYKNGVMLNPFN